MPGRKSNPHLSRTGTAVAWLAAMSVAVGLLLAISPSLTARFELIISAQRIGAGIAQVLMYGSYAVVAGLVLVFTLLILRWIGTSALARRENEALARSIETLRNRWEHAPTAGRTSAPIAVEQAHPDEVQQRAIDRLLSARFAKMVGVTPGSLAASLFVLAEFTRNQGKDIEAKGYYSMSLEYEYGRDQPYPDASRGELEKRLRVIERYYHQLLSSCVRHHNIRGQANYLCGLGQVWFATGRMSEAQEAYRQALVLHRELRDRSGEGTDLYQLARIYDSNGNVGEAEGLYRESLGIAREISNDEDEADILLSLGALLIRAKSGYGSAYDQNERRTSRLRRQEGEKMLALAARLYAVRSPLRAKYARSIARSSADA